MPNSKDKKKSAERNFGINIVAVDENGKSLGLDLDGLGAKDKVTASRTLPKNSKIQLKMLFPAKEDLNLVKTHGTIKWIKQIKKPEGKFFLIGVHFREASNPEKEKIARLWKTHRTK